ncbi:MAG: deoxyguanosinetriphosphate triphosphohydrolase family protein, partial [Stellaceae bacterium]
LDQRMRAFGGFDHNAQSLRVVTLLEARYAAFDGLNLTWETLEGLAKHNGPLPHPPPYIAEYDQLHPLLLSSHPSAEAQVAALADDIAYHSHDLDDGMRAGLFSLPDIAGLPLVGNAFAEARAEAADAAEARLRHETIRRVIDRLIGDLVAESEARLAALQPQDADAIRDARRPVIAFSPRAAEANAAIKEFLVTHMYRHWRVNRMTSKARRLIAGLFTLLEADPALLPAEWQQRATRERATPGASLGATAVTVADYIAGMTDRYALDEHRRLTDLSVPG